VDELLTVVSDAVPSGFADDAVDNVVVVVVVVVSAVVVLGV